MALLKNLGAEVAQIRESIQQPNPAQTQYTPLPSSSIHHKAAGLPQDQDKEEKQLNMSKGLHHSTSTQLQILHA